MSITQLLTWNIYYCDIQKLKLNYIEVMQMFWMLLSYWMLLSKLCFGMNIWLTRTIYKVTRQQLNSECVKVNLKILAVKYCYQDTWYWTSSVPSTLENLFQHDWKVDRNIVNTLSNCYKQTFTEISRHVAKPFIKYSSLNTNNFNVKLL